MPTLATFRNKHQAGFTLIELMVVLVLAGLVISLVAPNMLNWLGSRERASELSSLKGALAMLPLESRLSGHSREITTLSEILPDLNARVETPIVISANGFCQQGVISVGTDAPKLFRVTSPLCELEQVNAQ